MSSLSKIIWQICGTDLWHIKEKKTEDGDMNGFLQNIYTIKTIGPAS